MAIVRITAPNQPERLKRLDEGETCLGSDFACGVVLIDRDILPEHIRLTVADDQIRVQLYPGATGTLCDRKGNTVAMESGVDYKWASRQVLKTADIEIDIAGVPIAIPEDMPSVALAMKSAISTRPRAIMTGGMILLAVIAQQVLNFEPTGPRTSTALSATDTPLTDTGWIDLQGLTLMQDQLTPDGTAAQESRPSTGPLRLLQARSLVPEGITGPFNEFEARLFPERTQEATIVTTEPASSGLETQLNYGRQNQIISAINIVIDSSGSEASVVSFEDGELLLRGLRGDDEKREKLRARILRDVSGIRLVTFEQTFEQETSALLETVSAVWLGARPYVVMSDGSIILPGQELKKDIELVRILSTGRIAISMNGSVREVSIK